MRIIITGGAGFIGSHIADRLLSEGNEVICIDNLCTGSTNNLNHIRNPKFTFIHYDVTNYLFIDGDVDMILHFASPASPIDYLKMPIQTLKVGSLGTHKALGLALAKKAGFLLASTSETYGDPLENPQKESYWGNVNPIGPRGVYDEAKRFAEALTMAYHRYHNVDTKIVRIFNTYGPRMRLNDGRLIPTLLGQALRGEKLTIFGDGSQTRSFCFISDLVEGIVKTMKSDLHDPVNLGNPREMSINEFVEIVKQIMKTDVEISHKPLPVDDPKVRRPDITRAKRELGWEPKIKLEDGLLPTIEYFRNLI